MIDFGDASFSDLTNALRMWKRKHAPNEPMVLLRCRPRAGYDGAGAADPVAVGFVSGVATPEIAAALGAAVMKTLPAAPQEVPEAP